MEKKVVIARAEVAKGKENDFLAIVPSLIEGTRAEAGNLSYTLYQNPFNPSEFIFYEEYTNQAAIDSHNATAHFQAFASKVGELLAKDLEITTY